MIALIVAYSEFDGIPFQLFGRAFNCLAACAYLKWIMREQERAEAGSAAHLRKCRWRRLFCKRVMRKPSAASEHSEATMNGEEASTTNGEEASQAEGSGSQHLRLFDFSFVSE